MSVESRETGEGLAHTTVSRDGLSGRSPGTVSRDGTPIAFWRSREGPPLVLVHATAG